MRNARHISIICIFIFLSACGGSDDNSNTTPDPVEETQEGSLQIIVSGLPDGSDADISISGPDGFSQLVLASVTLTSLTPGEFTVTAESVTNGNDEYEPDQSVQNVSVEADQEATVTVNYELVVSESDIFPVGLAVAAPTDITASQNGNASEHLSSVQPFASGTGWTSAYVSAVNRINALLTGTTPVNDAFTPALFFNSGVSASCYGPSLLYRDHPDAATPNSGELPGGDLMLWQSTDANTGHTCSAAQLNARLNGVKGQSYAALMGFAAMIYVAIDSGISAPAVGDTLDLTSEMNALSLSGVTFNSVEITRAADQEWRYVQDYSFSYQGLPRDITASMVHISGDDEYEYEGLLQYSVNGDDNLFVGGNCAQSDRTLNGSLAYERSGESSLKTQSRVATFCGHDAAGFVTDSTEDDFGQVSAALTYDATTAPNGWSENFNLFAMDMDPTTLEGSYAYVWQAGVNDSHTRVFLMGVNYHATGGTSVIDGEAYAGFGNVMDNTEGNINGMICNWAGPNNSHTLQDFGQRQFFSLNETTFVFETPTGGEDINYAPTNSCSYDGSGTFTYDTDLDGDLSDESASAAISADLMSASDTDSDGTATMAEAIAARGYTLPSVPGGFPGS